MVLENSIVFGRINPIRVNSQGFPLLVTGSTNIYFQSFHGKVSAGIAILHMMNYLAKFSMMNDQAKTREQLIIELEKLGQELEELKAVFIKDNPKQKKVLQALRESEEKYRNLFANNPQPMWIYDLETMVFLEVNNAAIKHYGYTKEEFLSMTLMDIRPGEDIDALLKLVENRIQELSLSGEWRHRKKDGKIIDVEIVSHALTFNGRKARYVQVNDITDRKQTELELIKARDKSEIIDEKYQILFETITEGVALNEIVYNEKHEMIDYRVVEVNKAYCEITGLSPEQFIGNYATRLYGMSPDFIKSFWEQHKDLKETVYSDMYNPLSNRYFYISTSPFVEDRFVTVFFDITNLKQAELALKEKNDQLIAAKEKAEESDRLKSAFLANMSHEIRTPMNGILGFTELLKEPQISAEEQKNYISLVEKSGERLLHIINDVIDISKIESGLMSLKIQEVNINKEIQSLIDFFRPETELKGIRLFTQKPLHPAELVIKTDQEKACAILTNLIKNAIKFTSKGSIECSCKKKDGYLQFFVKDSGHGISLEQKEVIFERFRQGSESLTRKYEGAGLGLSISKAYVEMLGGKIWVESKSGKGSTFFFTIPFKS
ncbi:MAG: PAS domain S-box protein [Bacteroidales bacterium]|jgi:hypothetical protein